MKQAFVQAFVFVGVAAFCGCFLWFGWLAAPFLFGWFAPFAAGIAVAWFVCRQNKITGDAEMCWCFGAGVLSSLLWQIQ